MRKAKNNQDIVVFGAGKHGREFCAEFYENIIAIIDNDPDKQGGDLLGIPIYSLDSLKSIEFRMIYIAIENAYEQVLEQLVKMGINQERISLYIIEKMREKKQMELKEHLERSRDKLAVFMCLEDEYINMENYEKKWAEIKRRYSEIYFYRLHVASIGEMLTRYFEISAREKNEADVLEVFLPQMDRGFIDRICNHTVLEMLRQKINIPSIDDLKFWDYIDRTHRDEINTTNEWLYEGRGGFRTYKMRCYESEFDCNRKAEYDASLNYIGICRQYVCFAARSNRYNNTGPDTKRMEQRNMDFVDFFPSIKYLEDFGIQAVRMGKEEVSCNSLDNLIDFAGKYYDETMDVYIMAHSLALVTSGSGIYALAMMFSIPVLVVNQICIAAGTGGFRYTDADIYMPRKYYDVNKRRYLSLLEMAEADRKCFFDMRRYNTIGIEFHNNTPEEIRLGVKELLRRIKGTWTQSDEDDEIQEEYQKITDIIRCNRNDFFGQCVPWKISTTYLRNNRYLLNK